MKQFEQFVGKIVKITSTTEESFLELGLPLYGSVYPYRFFQGFDEYGYTLRTILPIAKQGMGDRYLVPSVISTANIVMEEATVQEKETLLEGLMSGKMYSNADNWMIHRVESELIKSK